jgi:bifunctional DNA-binding transcriptional regulator/antitoxin component of YhaV-PrlF toxin-antitoxin module
VTLPKSVRDALGICAGDEVVSKLDGDQASIARRPSFLELEGSIRVVVAKRGASWDEVVGRTRAERADTRR